MAQNNQIIETALQYNKAFIAALIVVIFILMVVVIIQAKEIRREKCKVNCEKYKTENEQGLFIQLENLVWWFKRNWSLFVVYTASSSVILLFLLTLIFPQKDTLTIMNNWVSLILGFTALFMSIASMVLSFYNVEQSHNNALQSTEMNGKIDMKLENLDELKKQLLISTEEIKQAREEIKDTKVALEVFRNETSRNFEEVGGIRSTREGRFEADNNWQVVNVEEWADLDLDEPVYHSAANA